MDWDSCDAEVGAYCSRGKGHMCIHTYMYIHIAHVGLGLRAALLSLSVNLLSKVPYVCV